MIMVEHAEFLDALDKDQNTEQDSRAVPETTSAIGKLMIVGILGLVVWIYFVKLSKSKPLT